MRKELTKQQEIFCQEVAKGNTYIEAYYVAYPKSKNWKKEGAYVQASKLKNNFYIQQRINELKVDTASDVSWTRKRVLSNINYLINENKQNIERKKQIIQESIDDKYQELIQWSNLKDIDNVDIKRSKSKYIKINKRNKGARIT